MIMYRKKNYCSLLHIYVFLFLSFLAIPVKGITMKVGETKKLSIGNISHFKGCVWTITNPEEIVFTSTPQSYSTEVEIQAIKPLSTVTPCVVFCEYYYLELDPTTGRYIYSRTGYKEWNIFVREDGNNNNDDDEDDKVGYGNVQFSTDELNLTVNTSVTLTLVTGNVISWSSDNESVATITKGGDNLFNIKGVSPGVTYVRANGQNGSTTQCLVTVSKAGSVGSVFTARTEEGVSVKYTIIDTEKKYCQVGGETTGEIADLRAISANTSGQVTIPWNVNGYTVIGIRQSAFNGCKQLKYINLPNTIEYIDNFAFYECENLSYINIPNGTKGVSYRAFYGCKMMTSFKMPESVTYLGDDLFLGCKRLRYIEVDESNKTYDSRNRCNAIIETSTNTLLYGCYNSTIPDGIECIGDEAFYNTDIQRVDIPASVRKIGYSVFSGCSVLSSVFIYSDKPSQIELPLDPSSVFYGCYAKTTLFIPIGSLSKYKSSEPWKRFKNIVEKIDTSNSIEDVDDFNKTSESYTIGGIKGHTKGINIVKMRNGTYRKILR